MMGCIGKITSFIETPDYRIVLNLEGVCRFILEERNLTPNGYYQANIDCHDYLDDLNTMEPQIDRDSLINKYENFFKMKKSLRLIKMFYLILQTFNYYLHLAMLAPI